MPFFKSVTRCLRVPRFLLCVSFCSFVSLFALAQVTLRFRLLSGYALNADAPVNKGKPTLFIFEQDETFRQVFKQTTATGNRSDRSAGPAPNFDREMVLGIATPATGTPPKLTVSKVFVQDSTLTVRYIRVADTTKTASATITQPMLLLAIPKQTVLKTKLVENGKVVQTIQKRVN